ncbi:hypothetical protein C450_20851 [Halococcus salifodinae DSM 8989]|uniref:Uncharacterized protein n=2 Tax=Halococcus salifodinae TaxID=36738 RepID=M0MQ13_9EURY|nr:hypothetical protein C450_20851 [Halococcus salifodinae DSM 8989]
MRWPARQEVMIEMSSASYERRIDRQQRHQWVFRRLGSRALKWAILSYAFVTIYGTLYGSHPVVVHRLGISLAALCGVLTALFAGLFVVSKLTTKFTTWQYHREASI